MNSLTAATMTVLLVNIYWLLPAGSAHNVICHISMHVVTMFRRTGCPDLQC